MDVDPTSLMEADPTNDMEVDATDVMEADHDQLVRFSLDYEQKLFDHFATDDNSSTLTDSLLSTTSSYGEMMCYKNGAPEVHWTNGQRMVGTLPTIQLQIVNEEQDPVKASYVTARRQDPVSAGYLTTSVAITSSQRATLNLDDIIKSKSSVQGSSVLEQFEDIEELFHNEILSPFLAQQTDDVFVFAEHFGTISPSVVAGTASHGMSPATLSRIMPSATAVTSLATASHVMSLAATSRVISPATVSHVVTPATVSHVVSPRTVLPGIVSPAVQVSLTPAFVRSPCDGVDHLNKLLKIMCELKTLREQNASLERECSEMRDSQRMLKLRNNMLMYSARQVARYHSTKRHAKSIQVGSRSRQQRVGRTDSGQRERHIFQHSLSVGSVHCETETSDHTTKAVTVPQPCEEKRKPEGSGKPFARGERKRSKKLQEKWEQVKKVFSNKQEAGQAILEDGIMEDDVQKRETRRFRRNKNSLPSMRHSSAAHEEEFLQQVTYERSVSLSNYDANPEIQKADAGVESNELWTRQEDMIINTVRENLFVPALHHSPVDRRQSNPAPSPVRLAVTDGLSKARASSFKIPKVVAETVEGSSSKSLPTTPVEPASIMEEEAKKAGLLTTLSIVDDIKRARTAWDKVKDIIQTRRDSLKKKGGQPYDDDLSSAAGLYNDNDDDEVNGNIREKEKLTGTYGTDPSQPVTSTCSKELSTKRSSVCQTSFVSTPPLDFSVFLG